MAEWATFEDVTLMFEGTVPDEAKPRVERLILLAQKRLERAMPSIQARMDDGSLDPELVRGVVVDMVLRVVRRPNMAFDTETAGDFAYRINQALASGLLQVTDADLAVVRPAGRRRVGTIPLGVGWP